MQTPDQWTGAVAVITRGVEMSARPIAHVLLDGDKLQWVEPSYADPAGPPASAVHAATDVTLTDAGIQCRVGPAVVYLVPYDRQEHRDLVGDALDWYGEWLKTEKRTWADERARVIQAMAVA